MHVLRNIKARSCEPLLLWKSSKYYILWVCNLVLGIQHPLRMRYIVICGLSGSTIFFNIFLINGTSFVKKKKHTQNVCFDFLHSVCLKHFSF